MEEKLLLITFRQSLEQELARILHEIGIKTYTMISGVSGMGETGAVPGPYDLTGWIGANSIIILALNEEQEKLVVEKLKGWHDHLVKQQPSLKIPMRIFVLPCSQVL